MLRWPADFCVLEIHPVLTHSEKLHERNTAPLIPVRRLTRDGRWPVVAYQLALGQRAPTVGCSGSCLVYKQKAVRSGQRLMPSPSNWSFILIEPQQGSVSSGLSAFCHSPLPQSLYPPPHHHHHPLHHTQSLDFIAFHILRERERERGERGGERFVFILSIFVGPIWTFLPSAVDWS